MMFGEKAIDSFAAEAIEVVLLVDLHYFYLVDFAVEVVDLFDGRVLFAGDVAGPIASGGNHEHGLGSEHGGDFDVAGAEAQSGCILAEVAALHDGRNHIHRGGELHAVINGVEEKGLGTAARGAGNTELRRIDIAQRGEKIEGAD